VNPLQTDRVRRHTAAAVLRRIDEVTADSLNEHASAGSAHFAERLQALDREWDIDRTIEAEASAMGLLALGLGAFASRRLLALPVMIAASMLLYGTTGRYPLLPIFRRLGLRTAREIARERYALKALRGDFANMQREPSTATVATTQVRTATGVDQRRAAELQDTL
jgi:hypothetical protein